MFDPKWENWLKELLITISDPVWRLLRRQRMEKIQRTHQKTASKTRLTGIQPVWTQTVNWWWRLLWQSWRCFKDPFLDFFGFTRGGWTKNLNRADNIAGDPFIDLLRKMLHSGQVREKTILVTNGISVFWFVYRQMPPKMVSFVELWKLLVNLI